MEICVATDLWGHKDNIKMTIPSFTDLKVDLDEISRVYDEEVIRQCPPSISCQEVPRFVIAHAQILVDEGSSQFVDLVSAKQLFPGCQLFVFQPPTVFHSDSRELIPVARVLAGGVTTIVSPSSPPRSARRLSPVKPSLTMSSPPTLPLDAAQKLFTLMSKPGKSVVATAEVRARLISSGIDAEDAVRAFPLDSHPTVNWNEWLHFCEANPRVLSLLSLRCLDETKVEVESGSKYRSPPRSGDRAGRDTSPRRTHVSPGKKQAIVCQRLFSGLSSIVTCRDRERQDFSHAVQQRTTPVKTGSTTPNRTRFR